MFENLLFSTHFYELSDIDLPQNFVPLEVVVVPLRRIPLAAF